MLSAFLLWSGLLAGCGTTGTAKSKGQDPLLGPPPGSPVAGTPTSKTSNAALAGTSGGLPSTPPVTITPASAVSGTKTGAWPPASAPGARPLTYDQAQAVLAGRGVQWQRLEAVGSEWKFTCSLPSRQDPARSRTYEGRAATYLAAIQAVLEQMDQEPA